MPRDEAYSPPFDEQAALEELERLRDAIEESRRRRNQTSEEFEAFVRSFRTPPPESAAPTAPAPTPPIARAPVTPRPAAPPSSIAWTPAAPPSPAPAPPTVLTPHNAPPVAAAVPWPAVAATPDPVEAFKPETGHPFTQPVDEVPRATEASAPPTRRPRAMAPRLLGGAAILIAVVVLLIRPWQADRSDSTPSSSTGGAATTASAPATTEPAQAPIAPVSPPAATVETPHAMEAELNVDRRVWVRVIVDGERVIERELAAGTRIPLQADRAIVIRVGNAGALRLTINGTDRGPLGDEGEIVTRTFTAQAR